MQRDNPYTYPTNALTKLRSSFRNLIENGLQSGGTTSSEKLTDLGNCSQVGMFTENIPDPLGDMLWLMIMMIMYCTNSMYVTIVTGWF